MGLLTDWITHEAPPDGWTADRCGKARLLDLFDGDVEAATREWKRYRRTRFIRWCVEHQRIGRGDRAAAPATDGGAG